MKRSLLLILAASALCLGGCNINMGISSSSSNSSSPAASSSAQSSSKDGSSAASQSSDSQTQSSAASDSQHESGQHSESHEESSQQSEESQHSESSQQSEDSQQSDSSQHSEGSQDSSQDSSQGSSEDSSQPATPKNGYYIVGMGGAWDADHAIAGEAVIGSSYLFEIHDFSVAVGDEFKIALIEDDVINWQDCLGYLSITGGTGWGGFGPGDNGNMKALVARSFDIFVSQDKSVTVNVHDGDPIDPPAEMVDGYYILGVDGWDIANAIAPSTLLGSPYLAYWPHLEIEEGEGFKIVKIESKQAVWSDSYGYSALNEGNGKDKFTDNADGNIVALASGTYSIGLTSEKKIDIDDDSIEPPSTPAYTMRIDNGDPITLTQYESPIAETGKIAEYTTNIDLDKDQVLTFALDNSAINVIPAAGTNNVYLDEGVLKVHNDKDEADIFLKVYEDGTYRVYVSGYLLPAPTPKPLPVLAAGASATRVSGTGIYVYLDNTYLQINSSNAGDIASGASITLAGSASEATEIMHSLEAVDKAFQDYSNETVCFYITMNNAIDSAWNSSLLVTMQLTIGGTLYEGSAQFVKCQYHYEPSTFTLYFRDASWWHAGEASTAIRIDAYAPKKMNHLTYVEADKYNYWSIQVPTSALEVTFLRYNPAGDAYWNASTVTITLEDRDEYDMYDISATEASWTDNGGGYVTGVWAPCDLNPR